MHPMPYTVRTLIFSPDGEMHLDRPAQTYATSAEARIVGNAVLAAHRAGKIKSLVQVHDIFGGRVDACHDCPQIPAACAADKDAGHGEPGGPR